MIVEYFEDIFPGVQLWKTISSFAEISCLLSDAGTVAGQQLIDYVTKLSVANGNSGELLFNPKSIQYQNPDLDVRRRLSQTPTIAIKHSDRKQHEASLTRQIYDDVCLLADSLYISEMEAFSLFFYVSQNPDIMSERSGKTRLAKRDVHDSVEKELLDIARELYFFERSCYLQTHLILLQLRRNSAHVAHVSDSLLQSGLIKNMAQQIRDYTLYIQKLRKNDNLRQHLEFSLNERLAASECLFFAAYDVQWTADEVVIVVDLIRDLTNGLSGDDVGLRKLHPLNDVPDTSESTADLLVASMANSPWPEHLREKNALQWQRELVETVHTLGIPSLLRCVSVLVMSCITALGSQTVLTNRSTHLKNTFGKVRFFVSVIA
jgi:hypothetical protein